PAGQLIGQVLVQAAAAGDVDDLDAAADAEDGLVVGQGPADELDLGPVAARVGAVAALVPRLAVLAGIDVDASGQEEGIELVVDVAEGGLVAGEQGDEPGHAAEAGEDADVALAHDPARGQLPGLRLQGLSRDAYDRTSGQSQNPQRSRNAADGIILTQGGG